MDSPQGLSRALRIHLAGADPNCFSGAVRPALSATWSVNPPYHAPTCIFTHHARPSIEREGSTTSHFVTDGDESVLKKARAAVGDKDVKIGGGVGTVRQYLRAGLIDLALRRTSPGERQPREQPRAQQRQRARQRHGFHRHVVEQPVDRLCHRAQIAEGDPCA